MGFSKISPNTDGIVALNQLLTRKQHAISQSSKIVQKEIRESSFKFCNSPGTLYLSDLKILDSLYQKLLLSSGYTKIKFNVLKLNGYIIK